MVKNLHTAFDYITNTKRKDHICAKVVANWLVKMGDEYVGGIPPSGECITHKRELYDKFVNDLFSSEVHVHPKLKNMMTAIILRWYDDLVSLVKEEPLGRFKKHCEHPCISRILKSAGDVGLSEEDIIVWSDMVKRDFISKNCLAMPMSIISKS